MKSSIITMSCFSSSFGPGAESPVVMRTVAIRASSNLIPKNDSPLLPGEAGTKLLNKSRPLMSKNSISVLAPRLPCFFPGPLPSGWSTSLKTAPKPRTVALTLPCVPGIKNKASVMLLPTGEQTGAPRLIKGSGLAAYDLAVSRRPNLEERFQGVLQRLSEPDHRRALRDLGPTPLHRRSFALVREAVALHELPFALAAE